MIRQTMILSGTLMIFGAGFLTGRYTGVVTETAELKTASALAAAAVPANLPTGGGPAGRSAGSGAPAQSVSMAARAGLSAQQSRMAVAPDVNGFQPPGWVLTPQDRADLIAQQIEARDASLKQLDAMIQGLELGGASQEQIAHFREMKGVFEEAAMDDIDLSEINPPERSDDDLRSDFAASLEQSGLSAAEREQMLQPFDAGPITADTDPTDAERVLPPGAHR